MWHNRNERQTCFPPPSDAVPLLLLEDESEDALGLVLQAMKMFPVNEEVQLHGCGALQVLLETGQVGQVFQAAHQSLCVLRIGGGGGGTHCRESSLEGENPELSICVSSR